MEIKGGGGMEGSASASSTRSEGSCSPPGEPSCVFQVSASNRVQDDGVKLVVLTQITYIVGRVPTIPRTHPAAAD